MLDHTVVVFMSDNGGEAARLQALYQDYYAKTRFPLLPMVV
jgi:arylsulfatase A-like enzyme